MDTGPASLVLLADSLTLILPVVCRIHDSTQHEKETREREGEREREKNVHVNVHVFSVHGNNFLNI